MVLIQRPTRSPIEYLIERRFPGHKLLDIPPSIDRPLQSRISADERRRRLDAVEAYRKELKSKSTAEVQELFERECALARQELAALADREEQGRPFNRPDAKADFAHWCKATYWTLDEALALSFGKAPEVVTWKAVEPYVGTSPFAKQFARVRDLAIRAKNWNQLYDPVLPGIFLAWAKRSEIPVSEELIGRVDAQGIVVGDWKDSYDKLKQNFDELLADRDKAVDLCRRLMQDNNTLKDQCAKIEETSAAWQFDEDQENYPEELDIAMQAWRAAANQRDPTMNPKQQLGAWLAKHYRKLSGEARDRIATVCNWEKRGGRKSRGQ